MLKKKNRKERNREKKIRLACACR